MTHICESPLPSRLRSSCTSGTSLKNPRKPVHPFPFPNQCHKKVLSRGLSHPRRDKPRAVGVPVPARFTRWRRRHEEGGDELWGREGPGKEGVLARVQAAPRGGSDADRRNSDSPRQQDRPGSKQGCSCSSGLASRTAQERAAAETKKETRTEYTAAGAEDATVALRRPREVGDEQRQQFLFLWGGIPVRVAAEWHSVAARSSSGSPTEPRRSSLFSNGVAAAVRAPMVAARGRCSVNGGCPPVRHRVSEPA
ncbi:hypothetical protein MTO96_022600 [Rhipicephalus appendiculatus]